MLVCSTREGVEVGIQRPTFEKSAWVRNIELLLPMKRKVHCIHSIHNARSIPQNGEKASDGP